MKNVKNSVLYLYEVLSQLYWWKHLNIAWLYLNNLSSKFFQLQMYQTNLNICDKLRVGWVVVVISAVALYVLSFNFRSYLSVKWIIMHEVGTVKFLAVRLIQCYHIFQSIKYLDLYTESLKIININVFL